MDSISNKIEMKFEFDLNKKIDKSLIETKNRKILADIEGELVITVGSEIFFREQGILLLEFGILLSNWNSDVNKGLTKNFIYETMDYSEGPILEFTMQKNCVWGIQSQWEQFHVYETFSLHELTNCSRHMLQELNDKLKEVFKIDFDDYTIK